ncbi:MAG: hypothetical protein HY319_08685 [Armatimonadetes bacterium]|nr:hypothetical protein [Armatimonadota bacterium]
METLIPLLGLLLVYPTLLWGALKLFKVPDNGWFRALTYYLSVMVLAFFCGIAAWFTGFGQQAAMIALFVLALWLLTRMYNLSFLQALVVTVTAHVLLPFGIVLSLQAFAGTVPAFLKVFQLPGL